VHRVQEVARQHDRVPFVKDTPSEGLALLPVREAVPSWRCVADEVFEDFPDAMRRGLVLVCKHPQFAASPLVADAISQIHVQATPCAAGDKTPH
jgi:hypothetical protein